MDPGLSLATVPLETDESAQTGQIVEIFTSVQRDPDN